MYILRVGVCECVCWILLANVVNALTPTNNTMLLWFFLERNLCFELFRWVSILRMVFNFLFLFLCYVYLVHRSCCNFIRYISHKEVLPCREIEKTSWSSEKGVHVIKTNKARCNVCFMLHKRFIYVLVFFSLSVFSFSFYYYSCACTVFIVFVCVLFAVHFSMGFWPVFINNFTVLLAMWI